MRHDSNKSSTIFTGTHDIQSIEVRESNGIFVTGESLNGSQVSGIFTIAYSLTEDYDVHYSISKQVRNQQRIVTKINQLPGNKYNVSAFSLVNGLPFTRAATKPQSVILSNVKGKHYYIGFTCQIVITVTYNSNR